MRTVESEKFLCCEVRTWALLIGWSQTILSAITAVSYFLFLTLVAIAINQAPVEHKESLPLPSMTVSTIVINILLLLVNCVGGVVLILGVKWEEAVKLRVWKTLQIILLLVTIITEFITTLMSNGILWSAIFAGLGSILYGLTTICCIGLVDIHRYELEDSQFPRVNNNANNPA